MKRTEDKGDARKGEEQLDKMKQREGGRQSRRLDWKKRSTE